MHSRNVATVGITVTLLLLLIAVIFTAQHVLSEDVKQDWVQQVSELGPDSIHILTFDDGSPYQVWQVRACYESFLQAQVKDHACLSGFTMVVHRRKELVGNESALHIPTVKVPTYNAKCDDGCDYPPLERPHALCRWLDLVAGDATMLKGTCIMSLDADMLVLSSPRRFVQSADLPESTGFAALFTYMVPRGEIEDDYYRSILGNDFDLDEMPKTGGAPTALRYEEWKIVAPLWMAYTVDILERPAVKEKIGWIAEMVSFSLAICKSGVKLRVIASGFQAMPPFVEEDEEPSSILHLTYPMAWKGFKFNKRDYASPDCLRKMPRVPRPSPATPDGEKDATYSVPVGPSTVSYVNRMLDIFEAV